MNNLSKDEIFYIFSYVSIDNLTYSFSINREYLSIVNEYHDIYIKTHYPRINKYDSILKKIYMNNTHCFLCSRELPVGKTITTLVTYFTHTPEKGEFQLYNYHPTCLEPAYIIKSRKMPKANEKGHLATYTCPYTYDTVMGFNRYNI